MWQDRVKALQIAGYILSICFVVFSQSGGQFEIKQSVLAGGGSATAGGTFGLTGTAGQPAAGAISLVQPFRVRGGFWQGDLAPTAAHVSISGRVVAFTGNGIPRTTIVVTSASAPTIRTSLTNGFGYFRIDDVEAGRTYVLNAHHKQFQFAPQVIHVVDDVLDIQITPLP